METEIFGVFKSSNSILKFIYPSRKVALLALKNILFIVSIIACILILFVSHYQYQQKLAAIASEAKDQSISLPTGNTHSGATSPSQKNVELGGLLEEWAGKKEEGEAINLTFFGSVSLSHGVVTEKTWPNLLATNLLALANRDFNTTIIDVERASSIEVLAGNYVNEVIQSDPDILLIEPFILNNNGVVLIEDSLEHIRFILTTIENALPETDIVIMPANPIYGANFYLAQIESLETFAAEESYLYADHWEAWPSTEDEALQDYLEDGRPNEAGHMIWAEYMLEYLTSSTSN